MILVTGSVLARPETFDEVLGLSTEHVLRSRGEPGCISHAVYRDTEEPLRLAFVERWADLDALRAHFVIPASLAFGKALAGLASEAPELKVYQASEVEA